MKDNEYKQSMIEVIVERLNKLETLSVRKVLVVVDTMFKLQEEKEVTASESH